MKYLIITLLICGFNCVAKNTKQKTNIYKFTGINNSIQSVSEQRLWSNDGKTSDHFGSSVSADGDYVAVGEPSRSIVYIYKISNGIWRQTAQLKTNLSILSFGKNVSISGNILLASDVTSLFVFNRKNDESWNLTQQINIPFASLTQPIDSIDLDINALIVGVKKANNNNNMETGRAAIYQFNGTFWQFDSDLIANNGDVGDEFGKSVSLLNGRALIGAPQANNLTGAAYLFELNSSNQWLQEELVTADDAALDDQFGYSVAISNDFLFIGSPFDSNTEGTHVGALYIYNFPGTVLHQFSKLVLVDNIMHFGGSVAYSNNKIIVGTLKVDSHLLVARKAYVFAFDGFTWGGVLDVINPTDNQAGDRFAQSVAIDNDRIVIGADSDSVVTVFQDILSQGSAYIIEKHPTLPFWDSYTNISLNEATTQDQYGTSLSVSGDYAVIGAPYDDQVGEDAGAVYTYKKVNNEWQKLAKILPPDLTTLDLFGISASIDGSFMIVGAPNAKIGTFGRTGAVYFYQLINDIWQPIGRFNANDKQDLAEFGFSVSLKGNLALIGAPYDDNNGINNTGAAYLFDYVVDNNTGIGSWGQKKKLIASDAEFLDRFGYSVSLDQWAVIGAFSEDGNTAGNAGAVYLYKEVVPNSFIETKLQSQTLHAGDAFGYSVSISNNQLVVGAKGTNNNSGEVEFFTEDNLVWSPLNFTVQGLNQGDNLGFSVAIVNSQVTVGAPQIGNNGKGKAYHLTISMNGIQLPQELTTNLDLTDINDHYGYVVSTSGSQYFVGAPLFEFNSFNGGNNGIVHIFTDLPDAMFSNGFE